MEIPLVRVLGKMEREGIYLSLEAMESMKHRMQGRVDELTRSLYETAGY
ncbi:MAG: hypothetical protein KBS81_00170 [Spirochaetales bacterium]|nr:hypothetical protein [Candidatus Physcosoma equi]